MTWIAVVASTGVLLVGLILWVRHQFMIVTVRGSSMNPTYNDGERLLARRLEATTTLERGVVVVVDLPPMRVELATPSEAGVGAATTTVHGRVIKRVAAVPGDHVPDDVRTGHATVPPRTLVLRGDNPAASVDSRHYGLVRVENCLGTVKRRMG